MKYSGNVIELSHVTRYHDYLMVFFSGFKGMVFTRKHTSRYQIPRVMRKNIFGRNIS